MNKFWVIVTDVYKKNIKSFGFLTMVLSPIVMLLIIGGIIYFISQSENDIPEIAVLTSDQEIQTILATQEKQFTINSEITTKETAEKAMEQEELDGYLEVNSDNQLVSANYVDTSGSDTLDTTVLTGLLTSIQLNRKATQYGLTQQEAMELMSSANLTTETVRFEDGGITNQDSTAETIKMWSSYVVGIAIFIFIMNYASIIGTEIASEKGTRIMEIILSSVSSTIHFFGKLVGILLVCLTQIIIYVVLALVTYPFIKNMAFVQEFFEGINMGDLLSNLLGTTLIYFVLGIILYAGLAAFFGSLVTKIEDVSKAVTPLVFLALIGFYGGLFAFASPNQLIVKIGSQIPLFTPFIMPFRVASETVSTTGIVISIIVMVLFTILCTLLSLVMYRSNVLVYSDAGMMKTMKTSFSILKNERKKPE
ncbi:ABC transporter permease [Carnobacterium viridans]|uniref:ABC-2 type transport system permease protein n=1 Tax=Carnobacterium viridans TaxID=174587 RepID=A0A1H1B5X6_9LACT|nr:ABC transporter permease [Carnobacterium viridans]UDE95914.1 ABC transporter permease [Carnobacterium viridans]SDQ47355.1 ABC-2 type transport system permease protein [Carnobacterium viridans]